MQLAENYDVAIYWDNHRLDIINNNRVRWVAQKNGVEYTLVSESADCNNVRVAVCSDGEEISLYVNGEKQASRSISVDSFRIGERVVINPGYAERFAYMHLTGFDLYHRALTDAQVAALGAA